MLIKMGVKLTSEVLYGYYRDTNGKRTNFKNGDRAVYASEDEMKKNPLQRKASCGTFSCRIFHNGQETGAKCFNCHMEGHFAYQCKNEKTCVVCKQSGHEPGETPCKYHMDNQEVEAFGSAADVLSNMHMCNMKFQGLEYKSAEHAYQAEKARKCGRARCG